MFSKAVVAAFNLYLAFLPLYSAQSAGSPCLVSNDHIDPDTQKFMSTCGPKLFCSAVSNSANGICTPPNCRRDEFPFGYQPDETPPPLCPPGSFCPDNEGNCTSLLPVGSTCQLDRDDQCAPPPDWKILADERNSNGSICLNLLCTYSNVTLGGSCTIETTNYSDVDPSGQPFNISISKDNCRSQEFFCDGNTSQCVATKSIGSACQWDRECQSGTCSFEQICTLPPSTPLTIKPWQYAITSITIISAMGSVCVALSLVHKRHRLEACQELRDYETEQMGLRKELTLVYSASRLKLLDEKERSSVSQY